jgi:ribosome maturation protein SDO1
MSEPAIAKLEIKGRRFEILVDPEEAVKIKFEGKGDIRKALVVEEIFKDARKGDVAGDLDKYFGTDDVYKIAERIIKEGEVPISSEYRKKQVEQLKKRIIDEISREAIDANTNAPIPPTRIELAIEQIKFNFDINKREEDLKKELIDRLRKVLPLKIGVEKYRISFAAQYANQLITTSKKLGNVLKIDQGEPMSLEIEISMGKVNELINKIKAITNNSATITKI